MRARRYIIIGVLLWIALIMLLLLIYNHHRPKQVNLYKATPGGTNIQFPYLAGPHAIDFFTGSGFAAYDTNTQTTKNISPQFTLPTVSEMRWSKNGVLFKASGYTQADDLFPALNNKGLLVDQDYWWLYSFANQKITVVSPPLIQNQVMDTFWNSSGSDYCYVSSDGALYIAGDKGSPHVVARISKNSKIKQFNNSTITLAEGTSLKQINISTHQTKTLANALFQDSYVSPDGQTVAYVLNTHPDANDARPGDLYKVNAGNLKAQKVLSDFGGTMSGNDGDLFVGYTDTAGNNHLRLFPKSGKTIDYSLGASLNRGDSIGAILPVSSKTIYIISKTNNLVEVTNQQKTVSTPVSYRYKIQTDLYENGFEIHYDPYKDTYEVDIAANPYLAYQNASLDYIRSKRIDPNQIRIIWRAYDGVDPTNPNVDTTPGKTL